MGRDYGLGVMGDAFAALDKVAAARWLEALGCEYITHHIGYDGRRGLAAAGRPPPSPLDELRAIVAAVTLPVHAVGDLSLDQAIRTPEYGAPLVVLGVPLTIDADAKGADGDLERTLRMICDRVHGYGGVGPGGLTTREAARR